MTPVHNRKSQKHCQKVGKCHCCLQGIYCPDVKAIRDRHKKQEEVLPLSPGAPWSCAMRPAFQREGILKRCDFFRNTETNWCHEPVPKWIEQCQATPAQISQDALCRCHHLPQPIPKTLMKTSNLGRAGLAELCGPRTGAALP